MATVEDRKKGEIEIAVTEIESKINSIFTQLENLNGKLLGVMKPTVEEGKPESKLVDTSQCSPLTNILIQVMRDLTLIELSIVDKISRLEL